MKARARPSKSPKGSHWLVQGFEGLSKTHEWRIRAHDISAENIQALLRALAAKVGLTPDEIVGAHLARRAQGTNDLLRVARDGPRLRFSCGENPHFIAMYVKEQSTPRSDP